MVLMVAQEEEHLFLTEHQVTEQPDKVIEGLLLLVEEIEVAVEAEQEEKEVSSIAKVLMEAQEFSQQLAVKLVGMQEEEEPAQMVMLENSMEDQQAEVELEALEVLPIETEVMLQLILEAAVAEAEAMLI